MEGQARRIGGHPRRVPRVREIPRPKNRTPLSLRFAPALRGQRESVFRFELIDDGFQRGIELLLARWRIHVRVEDLANRFRFAFEMRR